MKLNFSKIDIKGHIKTPQEFFTNETNVCQSTFFFLVYILFCKFFSRKEYRKPEMKFGLIYIINALKYKIAILNTL